LCCCHEALDFLTVPQVSSILQGGTENSNEAIGDVQQIGRPTTVAESRPTTATTTGPASFVDTGGDARNASSHAIDMTGEERLALALESLRRGIELQGGDVSACQVLIRLLSNIIQNPEDAKYRRIRLTNPKIKTAVVDVDGALELLLACGFQIVTEAEEGDAGGATLVLESGDPLDLLQNAVTLLLNLQPKPSSTPIIILPARNTRILLPQHVDAQVPEWFFERSGAEVKAAVLGAAKRREKDAVLRTQAMRDRENARNQSSLKQDTKIAVVKIRLPEGLAMVGDFAPDEKASAVLNWVKENLSDATQTFDLILPDRRSLWKLVQEPRKGERLTLKLAGFVPSITLNFRWTGDSSVIMKAVPTLHSHLLSSKTLSTVGTEEEGSLERQFR